jgi:hypothetical protein
MPRPYMRPHCVASDRVGERFFAPLRGGHPQFLGSDLHPVPAGWHSDR